MKTKSILYTLMFAAASFALLSNCSGSKKEDHAEAHNHEGHEQASGSDEAIEVSEPQFQVDSKFLQQLAGLFTSYVKLKDAFVSSDVSRVKTEIAETRSSLVAVDMKLLTGVAHNDWMNYLSPMETALKDMEGTEDIEVQRQSFSTLSDNLYKSIKAFGLGGKEAYYEYCPMAFNNEGGYWLSDQKEIRNPYFGDKMLTCGSVKEKLN